jgi:Domain of unknown function (DUF4331)
MKPLFKNLLILAAALPATIICMGSDHKDGPDATADHAADIADLYAWHDSAAGTFTLVLTFAGFGMPGKEATYDPNALYSIHLNRSSSSTFSNAADVDINIRFARNARGETGVQVENLPGATSALSGKVETTIVDGNKRKVFAGLRDDPFFFDLDGFKATLAKPASNSTLSFSNTHDTFAGSNVTAVVIELDLADVTVNGTMPHVQTWATSARRPTANAMMPKNKNSDLPFFARRDQPNHKGFQP